MEDSNLPDSSTIVALDRKQPLGICLVSVGQVVYQVGCPAVDDFEGWNAVVNGIRQRMTMGDI